jgi:TonB family protein
MLSNKLKTTFFLIALALHSIILLKQVKFEMFKKNPKTAKVEKKVRLKLRKPVQPKPDKKPKQIVNTQKQKNKSRPKKAKYLSHSNQSFERETVAAKTGRYKDAGKGTSRKKTPKVTVTPKKQVKPKMAQKAVKRKKSKNGKLSFSDLAPTAMKMPPKPKPKKLAAKQGLKNGDKSKKGLSQNNDYVEDIKLGDMTRLNTQEFKYYGFYHRIRQKLEQYWENSLRKKVDSIYRQGRRVASKTEKITSLRISLDAKGRIVDVKVRASSGVKELDDAAIESFNRAGPFPNPPTGMVKNGVAVLDWGFVVKS